MAVAKDAESTKLTVRVETGVSESTGKAKYGDRSISSVNPELTDDDAYAIASGYGDLQTMPVSEIKRTDTATLIE